MSTLASCPALDAARSRIRGWIEAAEGLNDLPTHPENIVPPDPVLAARLKRDLHDYLKANHPGVVFCLAMGTAIWVDRHTPPGEIEFRDMEHV